ncbi:hypothetical protein FQN50_006280 [Emmonsiellopsis sp. PD_5]|nr:hypothetical protein FQN50_006280 [Emmonsiellopsis sp. PD_5]
MFHTKDHELDQPTREAYADMKTVDRTVEHRPSRTSPSSESGRWDAPERDSSTSRQSDNSALHKCQSYRTSPPSVSRVSSRKSRRSTSLESIRSEPSPIMRFLSRQTPNLQLPPFESLGIAAPSPSIPDTNQLSRQSPSSSTESSIAIRVPSSSYAPSETTALSGYSAPMPPTPPEESHSVRWNPDSNSPISDPHPISHRYSPSRRDEFTAGESPPNGSAGHVPESSPEAVRSNGSQPNAGNNLRPDFNSTSWLKNGIELAEVSSLSISKTPGESVQMVSQTLPFPLESTSKSSPTSAFASIVQEIQRRLQPDQSPYVNIIHAVPPKFNLSCLPTSPPSTPNLFSPGDDYFNLTVFSSATPVPGYAGHEFAGEQSPSGTTHIPTPIVPPFSVHVSVVERYLPPSSPREYKDLFSAAKPSVLVDRLRELSPRDGNLVLIYPTQQGARTFKNHYLGPILDPLLRQMVVVNELSADIGKALGCMPAIAQMDDFETMQDNVIRLCNNLNQREPMPGQLSAGRGSRFNMVYSSKGQVRMTRQSWTEWYIQQETPRAREILNGYWRTGHRLPVSNMAATGSRKPQNREVTYPSLLQEIVEGIRRRSYSEGVEPGQGLEVGVFVIRRSQ